jgi:hypothetical protein
MKILWTLGLAAALATSLAVSPAWADTDPDFPECKNACIDATKAFQQQCRSVPSLGGARGKCMAAGRAYKRCCIKRFCKNHSVTDVTQCIRRGI